MVEITQDLVSDKLLWPLWRGIEEDYKVKYKKNIWEQFENAVRSASNTGSLKGFLNNFKRRIPTDIQAQYGKDVLTVIDSGEDETILSWLRDETAYLVLLCRIQNQDRKELFNAKTETK